MGNGNKYSKNKAGRKPLAKEVLVEAIRLIEVEGLTFKAVTEKMGISRSSIYKAFKMREQGEL